jgi:DNA primase
MSLSPAIRLLENERYLRMLRDGALPGTLLEVRYRTFKDRIGRFFLDWDAPDNARPITRLGQRTDVYVGCAARLRRRGRRQDTAPTPLLWADIDTPAATAALKAFLPQRWS